MLQYTLNMKTINHLAHHYAADVNMQGFSSLSPAVYRASTITFDSLDEFVARKKRTPDGYTYGITGTPTHRQLQARIAQLDGASHCMLVPSGQAAISVTMLAFLKAGDHLLITDSAYGPAHDFSTHLAGLGVDIERYDPCIGAGIAQLVRPTTRMIWMESPGSITMDIQDVAAITAVAKSKGILTAIDNTWATPLYFSPLSLGVDLCIHACSKAMGGHADLLVGSVSTNDRDLYVQLRALQSSAGLSVSADDCFLVQRGLDTMPLRVEKQAETALLIARQLQEHPMVEQVLHPALEDFPTHSLWKSQFSGSGSLFSVVLRSAELDAYRHMFKAFRHFLIGASYGSPQSLAAFYPAELQAARSFPSISAPVIRLAIGLEDNRILLDDLDQALACFERIATR